MNEDIKLKVLNASAGSGKTYSLVMEYLTYLFEKNAEPRKFASILAMTFTNKAAGEMKERIIQALDLLAYPELYGAKSLDYAEKVAALVNTPAKDLAPAARTILQHILHQYEDFSVMTIDRFNLKLIRSFSRDLNMGQNFEVVVNEKELITQTIDRMLSQLNPNNQSQLNQLVLRYSKAQLEDENSWDFRRSLIEFADLLRSEKNTAIIQELLETDFSESFRAKVKREKDRLAKEVVDLAQAAYVSAQNCPVDPGSIYGKSSTTKAIANLLEVSHKDISYSSGNLSKFVAKVVDENIEEALEFAEAARKFIAIQETNEAPFVLYTKFLSNFYNMALLKHLGLELQAIRQDEQIIRISEFNKLISELLAQESVPFIYERLGSRYRHYLLDEFQDTSRMQWLNLIPLVHESLGSANRNLIVGDPKQSLYRFNNGLPEQFVELPKLFNPEQDPGLALKSRYFEAAGNMSDLKDNWRSSPVIVEFNNRFFEHFRELLPEATRKFYTSVHQQAQSKVKGYVSIQSDVAPKTEKVEAVERYLLERLEECEQDGYKRGEICILGRTNRECAQWAQLLTRHHYQVVSDESLILEKDAFVHLILAYLRLRLKPHNTKEAMRFGYHYCSTIQQNLSLYFQYFIAKEKNEAIRFDAFIATYFGDSRHLFFRYENLYALIEGFVTLIGAHELKNPYIHRLADYAHEFDERRGSDLAEFIADLEQNLDKLAVKVPESEEAIKILTMHKSKGLEFPVVILPSMGKKSGGRAKYLLRTGEFVLYTELSKESKIDAVQAFTQVERDQLFTDETHLLYVAMTRPIERLYIRNAYVSGTTGEAMHRVLLQHFKIEEQEAGGIAYTSGERFKVAYKSESMEQFYFPKAAHETLWFPDIALMDESLVEEISLSPEQRFGNQFHILLTKVNRLDQVDTEVERLLAEGVLEQEFVRELKLQVRALLVREEYQALFKGAKEVLDEQNILSGEVGSKRPDKIILKENETIVLDFKTGLPQKKYYKQLGLYKQLLREMGLPGVKGYLMYTGEGKLEEV